MGCLLFICSKHVVGNVWNSRFHFRLEDVGVVYRRKICKSWCCIVGWQGGIWRSKIGLKPVTSPIIVSIKVFRFCHVEKSSTNANLWDQMFGASGMCQTWNYRWNRPQDPPKTQNPIFPKFNNQCLAKGIIGNDCRRNGLACGFFKMPKESVKRDWSQKQSS